MIVETYAGLCNRLRVLLSYRARYGPIEVIWPRDPEIANGHFLDPPPSGSRAAVIGPGGGRGGSDPREEHLLGEVPRGVVP